jgi:hypothetical protein
MVKNYAVVDVTQPEEEVTRQVCDLIMKFHDGNHKKPYKVGSAGGLE